MRSLLSWLGLPRDDDPNERAETETVHKIVRELDALPPDRARMVACFAYVLGRVAHADLDISDDETREMEAQVARHGDLPPQQAALVVEIAKSQNRLFGGTENFLVTRQLREVTEPPQRERLLRCLFEIGAADGSISAEEDQAIRQIADELGFSPKTFVDIRSDYSDQRSVLQRLERPRPSGDRS